jgi:ribosome biogenesis GTPase A
VLEGMGEHKDKAPVLLIMNKKDLIKPEEVAKKLEVGVHLLEVLILACIT